MNSSRFAVFKKSGIVVILITCIAITYASAPADARYTDTPRDVVPIDQVYSNTPRSIPPVPPLSTAKPPPTTDPMPSSFSKQLHRKMEQLNLLKNDTLSTTETITSQTLSDTIAPTYTSTIGEIPPSPKILNACMKSWIYYIRNAAFFVGMGTMGTFSSNNQFPILLSLIAACVMTGINLNDIYNDLEKTPAFTGRDGEFWLSALAQAGVFSIYVFVGRGKNSSSISKLVSSLTWSFAAYMAANLIIWLVAITKQSDWAGWSHVILWGLTPFIGTCYIKFG